MECQKNGCSFEAFGTCKYCHKDFCSVHLRANKPSSPSLSGKYYVGTPANGHPCPAYEGGFRTTTKHSTDHYYSSNGRSGSKTLVKIVVVLVVLLLLYLYWKPISQVTGSLVSSLNLTKFIGTNNNSTSTSVNNTNNVAISESSLTRVTSCVNFDLRIRVLDYLNNSQVQQAITYCQYYGYNPPNQSNTELCTYVKYCLNQYG